MRIGLTYYSVKNRNKMRISLCVFLATLARAVVEKWVLSQMVVSTTVIVGVVSACFLWFLWKKTGFDSEDYLLALFYSFLAFANPLFLALPLVPPAFKIPWVASMLSHKNIVYVAKGLLLLLVLYCFVWDPAAFVWVVGFTFLMIVVEDYVAFALQWKKEEKNMRVDMLLFQTLVMKIFSHRIPAENIEKILLYVRSGNITPVVLRLLMNALKEFQHVNLEPHKKFVDVGTVCDTAIVCLWGVDWEGYNPEPRNSQLLDVIRVLHELSGVAEGSITLYEDLVPEDIEADYVYCALILHHAREHESLFRLMESARVWGWFIENVSCPCESDDIQPYDDIAHPNFVSVEQARACLARGWKFPYADFENLQMEQLHENFVFHSPTFGCWGHVFTYLPAEAEEN